VTLYDTDLQPLELDLDLEELERAVRLTPRERFNRRFSKVGGWARQHTLDLFIVVGLLIVCGVVHAKGMYNSPARFDDEGTYTAYAWAVEFTHRLGHYTYWYAHPPLGWIQMAIWNSLTDAFARAPYAIAAGRELAFVCKLLSVALLYGLARRLGMTRVASTGAVLLFGLSPLAVYFTRTALLDNIVTPWLLAAFFLAAARKRTVRAAAGAAACFAIAVLSKETALLFGPALALLFWQFSDQRNRRFTGTIAMCTVTLMGLMYPLYAATKHELLDGPGHVSLQWAIKWQLFDRQGSGSIFDPLSTAHNVVHTWLILDPWLPLVSIAAVPLGLVFRRTRAVALAFAVQLLGLLRSGYLPYPFVIAMLPFAALTAAGVLDVIWQRAGVTLPWWGMSVRTLRGKVVLINRPSWSMQSPASLFPASRSWIRRQARRLLNRARFVQTMHLGRRLEPAVPPVRVALRGIVLVVVVGFIVSAQYPWRAGVHDLWHNDRDAGKATALAWLRGNVEPDQRVVVDDAYWVDLVRSGFDRDRVIWFTKLDVDSDVKLPKKDAWKAIDYVLLDHQDELSVHLNADGTASASTIQQFPTLGNAVRYSQVVARFGKGGDEVVIRRVQPELANTGTRSSSASRVGGSPPR